MKNEVIVNSVLTMLKKKGLDFDYSNEELKVKGKHLTTVNAEITRTAKKEWVSIIQNTLNKFKTDAATRLKIEHDLDIPDPNGNTLASELNLEIKKDIKKNRFQLSDGTNRLCEISLKQGDTSKKIRVSLYAKTLHKNTFTGNLVPNPVYVDDVLDFNEIFNVTNTSELQKKFADAVSHHITGSISLARLRAGKRKNKVNGSEMVSVW